MTSAKIVLFVTPSQDSTVFGIKTGLEKVLSRHGMRLQLVYTPFERRVSDIKALVDLWRPVGVVAAISDFDVRNLRVPAVLAAVEHSGRRHDVVANDSRAIGRLAAEELGRLGDVAYGYVSHPGACGWARQRGAAFREAVSANRGRVSSFRPQSLRMDDRSMVADFKKFVSGLQKPCGIFAANDEIAALAISVASGLGFSVPEDVAVVGVDDNPAYVECGQSPITSVVPDWEGIGRAAGERLLRRIDGDDSAGVCQAVAPRGIVRRASTRRLMRVGNTLVRKAMAYIRDNACSGITSSDVIAHIGCSRSLANLRFREATGMSILQAIHDERFSKAVGLASAGQGDVRKAAALCGYRSTAYFRREYKARTGRTFGEARPALSVCAAALFAVGAALASMADAPALVPAPKSIELFGGQSSTNASVVFSEDASIPKEGYRIVVGTGRVEVAHSDSAGRLYAQVTLDQLKTAEGTYPLCRIEDHPLYPWRGMLVDGASNFVDKDGVLAFIDAMVLHKMNVMHWHLTEDQSWRIPSRLYPELEKYGRARPCGAKEKTGRWRKVSEWIEGDEPRSFGPFWYSREDIAEIRAYARVRNVKIVPEIDVPGHVRAVLAAYPEFGCRTEYLATNRVVRWQDHGQEYEVLCIGSDAAVKFVMDELDELCELFPDSDVIHVGGDEAPTDRWRECPRCQARMKAEGLKTERELQGWLEKRISDHLLAKGRKMSGWAEIVETPGPDKRNTIPMAWLYPDPGLRGLGRFCPTFEEFTDMGYDIVAGSHKHEYFSTARAVDDEYFPLDPAKWHFLISLEDTYDLDLSCGKPRPGKGRVLGTQAFTWSGSCWNFFDLMYKTFPRACAVAEIAWGAPEPRDYRDFHRRMLVHAKRLRAMSIPCAPVDPPGSKRAIPASARQGAAVHARPTVYTHYMDPSRHPDDARRAVKPPDRALLGDKTHFMALRHASGPNIRRYIDEDRMGDFVWTYWGYFLKDERQLRKFIEEMRKRDLYIFDICAMLVGNAKPAGCYQFHLPAWAKKILEEEYGDHWLGMDNGEQDGAYVARDARGIEPTGLSRFAQYVAFQRHFEYMDLLLGNKIATLVSLTYGHQFLKENCYTMIGAETAQMLPNAQMYYSFIRGAGKQYGVPWFGNVSAFSRWGYKQYPDNPKDEDLGKFRKPHPLNGASLALMKKLMMAQIMYNSSAVGFEFGYYRGGGENHSKSEMSPVGKVHKSCQKWCDDHGQPGVMHSPVAVMFDFLSGWTFARHSYAGHATYRAWGALDFDEGDFFAHGVMDMLYPHYTNSGWWHDERGFNTDTPYGDIADCLLTDAPAWLLDQYGCLVLATKIEPREETRDKLRSYVSRGGHLVMPEGNRKALFPDGFGEVGKGRVTVIPGGGWGVVETPKCKIPAIAQNDEEVGNPYPLTSAARMTLDAAFRGQMIFGTSEKPSENGLSIITCRRGRASGLAEYTVAVLNNTWEEKPFSIVAKNGRIERVEELGMDRPERGEEGYLPYGIGRPDVGRDTETTIAGGGIRTFRVWLADEDVREVAEVDPPANPTGRFLFVRDLNGAIGPVKEAIFRRPSFFQQYDGVMLDWRYLWSRSVDDVEEQANWISLQQLKIGVDFTSGLNLFPDMRLVTNDTFETSRTWKRIDDVLRKMELLGAKTLVIGPHNRPGELSKDEFDEQFRGQVRALCRKAAEKGITVYFRNVFYRQFKKWPLADIVKIVADVNEPNFKIAPVLSVEEIVNEGKLSHGALQIVRAGAELVYLALPKYGRTGHLDTYLGTLAGSALPEKSVRDALRFIKESGARVVFAPLYDCVDEEFADLRLWESIDVKKGRKENPR